MEKYLKYSIVFLVLVFAGYGVITGLTGALPVILSANPYFFMMAVLFPTFYCFMDNSLGFVTKKQQSNILELYYCWFSCVIGLLLLFKWVLKR